MSIYEFVVQEPPFVQYCNDIDIINDYFPFWYNRMVKIHGAHSPLINLQNCIEDWCVTYYARKLS